MKHHAKKSTDSRRSCSYDQYGVFFGNLGDASCPKASGQYITHQQSLFIGYSIGNTIKSLICQWDTHIFRLATIDAASQCPTSIGVSAIIYITILAEETRTAERLYVDGYSVSWFYIGDFRTNFFNHSHHFVANGNAWNGTRHASVLDMQIACTDTAHRHTNNGIGRFNECRLRLLHQSELTFFDVCVC